MAEREIVRRGPHKSHKPVSEAAKEMYLSTLRSGMTFRRAAEMAGHPYSSFKSVTERDPEFAEAVREAKDIGTDVIEQEAFRRGVEGYDELVVGKVAPGIDGVLRDASGDPVVRRVYSDKLVEVLLKGRRPEYRDNPRIDVRNQTLNVTVEDRSAALADVARVLAEAGVDLGELAAAPAEVEGQLVDES